MLKEATATPPSLIMDLSALDGLTYGTHPFYYSAARPRHTLAGLNTDLQSARSYQEFRCDCLRERRQFSLQHQSMQPGQLDGCNNRKFRRRLPNLHY